MHIPAARPIGLLSLKMRRLFWSLHAGKKKNVQYSPLLDYVPIMTSTRQRTVCWHVCSVLPSSDAPLPPSDRHVYVAPIRLITSCTILMSSVRSVYVFVCVGVCTLLLLGYEACIPMSQKRIREHWCWGKFLAGPSWSINPFLHKEA